MALTESLESEVKDYVIVKFKKKVLTKTEKLYNDIKINHHGLIKYPGRFGKTVVGEKKCGSFKSAYSCENAHGFHVFLHSCNNINCPKCYINSIIATSKRVTTRFDNLNILLKKIGFKKRFLRSISINILPEEIFDYEDLQKLRARITKILKQLNFSGLLIFHAYRRQKGICHGMKYFSLPATMFFSPHFHAIGHGWIPNNFFKKFGFIIKHQRWLFNSKQVYIKVKYLLTHAGYFNGKHILTWFGHYSYNKLKKVNERIEYESKLCESCQERIYKIDFYESGSFASIISERNYTIWIPWNWYLFLDYNIYLKDFLHLYDFEYRLSKLFIRHWRYKRGKFRLVKI